MVDFYKSFKFIFSIEELIWVCIICRYLCCMDDVFALV